MQKKKEKKKSFEEMLCTPPWKKSRLKKSPGVMK